VVGPFQLIKSYDFMVFLTKRSIIFCAKIAVCFTALLLPIGSKGQSMSNNNAKLQLLLKRKVACNLFGNANRQYKNAQFIRNAAYGHAYFITSDFKYVKQKNFNDTTKYVSKDSKAAIKIWPGQTVSFPLASVDAHGKFIPLTAHDVIRVEKAVDEYISKIRQGKDKEIGFLKNIQICKSISGYNFGIDVKGMDGRFGYFYKISVLELPVSGDLVFNHFIFKYDLRSKVKYSAVGLDMANYFGNFLDKI
jgi:hypothetical protein